MSRATARPLAVCLVLAWMAAGCGQPAAVPPPGPHLAAPLAARVVDLMEHTFNGTVFLHSVPVICAARPFGVEPGNAATVEAVTRVYAWTYCVEVRPDGQYLAQAAIPVAIGLGRPPSLRMPPDGENHWRDRYTMFPANLHDIAAGNPIDIDGMRSEVDRQAIGRA